MARKVHKGGGAIQLPLPGTMPESDWRPPDLATLPSWADAKRVAFDVETRDDHLRELGPGVRRGAYITGYSFAIEDGPRAYVPIRHDGGDNVDTEMGLAYIRDQAKAFRGDLVGANLSYDLDFALEEGIDFGSVRFFRDVQIAEPLIYEHRPSYSLDSLCELYGLPPKDERLLRAAASAYNVDPKGGLWRLPARYVGAYGEADADRPLRVLRRQERELEDQGLWGIYDLESQLLPVLVRMTRRGSQVDMDRVRKMELWTIQRQRECSDIIHHHTGIRLGVEDFTRSKALAPALEYIGVSVPTTPKTQAPSVDRDFLGEIDHPVAEAMASAKKMATLRNTFCASIRRYEIKGRIHCTFNQLRGQKDDGDLKGTRTGRMSATNPNLQQQPIRDPEIGAEWRKIYVKDDDCIHWASLDYSQQEPRITVHYAELLNLPGAKELGDRYRNDPSTDWHTANAELTGLKRIDAKNCGLGLGYGMGGGKLCKQWLKLPTKWIVRNGKRIEVAGDEGQRIMDAFHAGAPYMMALAKRCEHAANRRGYITTLLGRRLRFERDASGNYDRVYKAMNKLIQGSAADQTKKAMIEADAQGIPIALQVHDELNLSVQSPVESTILMQIMQDTVKLRVPMRVDVGLGPSWGEAK
jgi:DNA polymerase I-like protein with 3'-5' exonuclease and polymerase domains